MKKLRFLALMAVAALLLVFPAIVLGQPVPPHVSKLVVSVDGSPAADGTKVTVWMDGTVQVASVTTSGGKAIFKIEGEAGSTGKAINFKVGGIDAAEEDIWEQGGHVDKSFPISLLSTGGSAVVSSTWSGLNQYLVDSAGMTLYLFTSDVVGEGSATPVSACTERCLGDWPPLFTDGDPVAKEQPEFRDRVNQDLLGSFERADGKGTQVTYNGSPLYHYRRDLKPGDTIGQYGSWYVVSPVGRVIVGGSNVDPNAGGSGVEAGQAGSAGAAGAKGVVTMRVCSVC